MRTSIRLWFVLVCTVWCGDGRCQGPTELCLESLQIPQARLVSSHCANLRPRRIVIVTTHNRQDRLKEQELFSKSVARCLRQSQLFDVVVSCEKMCRDKLPMRRGAFDEQALLALSDAHNVDAVLYCEIEQISAYEPMQLQTSLLLIDIAEAVSLMSATATIDLRDPATQQAYITSAGQSCDCFTTDTCLNSPSMFIDFAAGLCADGISSIWQ